MTRDIEKMNALVWGLAALISAVLLASALGKLLSLSRSAAVVSALRLDRHVRFPRLALSSVALIEVFAAAALTLADGLGFVLSATLVFLLFLVFLIVGLRAASLGSTDECGCFGDLVSSPLGAQTTFRNAVLLALSGLFAILAFLSGTGGPVSSVITGSGEPLGVAVSVWLALGAVWVVAVPRQGGSRPRRSGDEISSDHLNTRRAGSQLIAAHGEAIDPIQRALRGRAQLLLFVRRGCQTCEEIFTALSESEMRTVDARVIMAVGDGGSLESVFELQRDGVSLHVDPANALADQLSVPHSRPVGVLLGTTGEVVEPIAQGRDEVLEIMRAIKAAELSANTQLG